MRPLSWPAACCAPLALLLALVHCGTAVERHYYIAAVNINWDYGDQRQGSTFKKTVYRAYDADFQHAKTHPSWLGLLGPTLYGQEGDTLVVTFRNLADHPCTIHPHGIAYGKQSEGSLYFDNTSEFEKEDDVISSGSEHTYYWEVTADVAPKDTDPGCLTYTYMSHYDIVKDYNTGLIGTLLICKKDSLDDTVKQLNFHQEFVLLFGVFDENQSWYSKGGPPINENVKYTINGFRNGTIPGLSVCAHSKVNWHLLAMSSEQELFSVHFNGQVLQQGGHKVSSVGLISGTATSAEMVAVHPGRWLLSSHISKHLEVGMHGFLTVHTCEEFTAPKRRLTITQTRESQEWTYYIAAEEIIWDYAPNMPDNMDRDFRATFLKQSSERIGKQYKKAVFTQYKDESFKERAEHKQRKKELGILGPVIRAQIRDIIKIVFKNKASRPYSIYPHGLTIDKAAEGANYPEGGNQSHAVQPGETYTYVWRVVEEDEPLERDARCLTRMYHSAVNTPKDIASGLIGPLLICKSQSLNTKNVQLRADKEQHAMFAVFDENKSWYLPENINTYCGDPKKVKPDDPEFYKTNVMHTINGYVYESGQVLGFCNGEIVTWHVSSVGNQDDIQTATFYGHTFELNNREEDILSLFPMTGETITMGMANDGIWLLASLNTHETTKGLRVKFKDVECFRDYVKEDYGDYSDEEKKDTDDYFKVWKPDDESVLISEREKQQKNKKIKSVEIDEDTEAYADVLNLRSLHNTGNGTDDEFDISFLDHDDSTIPQDSGPSLPAEIKNTTHLGAEYSEQDRTEATLGEKFDTDDNNFTSKTVQNNSTEDTLLSFKDPLQDYERNITSEDSHSRSPSSTSEGHGDNATETETQLSVSIEEVEEDDDRSSGIFSYSVPPLNSPLNTAEEPEVEDIVLLKDGELVENISYSHLDEYNTLTTALHIDPIPEQLGVATLNVINKDVQVLNTTNMNSTLTTELIQQLNTTRIDLELSSEGVNQFSGTQPDSEFSNKDVQEFNNTQVDSNVSSEFIIIDADSDFSNKDIHELNSTQLDSEVSNKSAQTFNGTQESDLFSEEVHEFTSTQDSTYSSKGVQKFNSTQLDTEFSKKGVQEFNNSQTDSEISSKEVQEFITMEADSGFSNKQVQELNGTQLDSEFSNHSVQEFNNTQELNNSSKEDHKFNSTQVHSKDSSKEVQKFNSTQLDTQFSRTGVQEFNNTQADSDIPNEELGEFMTMDVGSDFSNKEVPELNSTQFDLNTSNKDVHEFNNTQESNISSEDVQKFSNTQLEVQKFNSTPLDTELSKMGDQEFNNTQADLEPSHEELQNLSTMDIDPEFSNKEVQELNSTQLDSEVSKKDVQDFNNTHKSNVSSEEIQEFNITQADTEFSSQNVTSSPLEAFTNYARNEELKPNISKLWNFSDKLNSGSLENTSPPLIFNLSSEGNISNGTWKNESIFDEEGDHINDTLLPSSSSEKGLPETEEIYEEEIIIYLKDHNNTDVILTTALDQQAGNWSYEGKHKPVTLEIPDDISKYITDIAELNETSTVKEIKKIVLKRLTPMKGYGLKTKKKKDYKPQPQSAMSPRHFSPRGFAPSVLTPRGTRPVSSEDDLQGKSIIIGVPRRDFSDYELYIPDQKHDFDIEDIPDQNEEYEYVEYKDPYKKQNPVLDDGSIHTLKMAGNKVRSYFITAEEVDWDYAGYGHRRGDRTTEKERPTLFKKVVFRSYLDSSFTTPHIRGEVDEHLGILGPVIKAEIDETIYIVFRNLASRPYSLHVNGLSYGKNMEGLKYDDESPYWYKQDDAIEPNATFIYIWTVNAKVGPQQGESDCRIWAYYSGVNPERDIHSGLIGPLLVCRKGTLNKNPVNTQEFMLLFMTFDESKSWYYESNRERHEKTNRKAVMDPDYKNNIRFSAINGIIYSLKGLRMYSNQLIKWHLINMGSPKDFHSIHFHGQTFLNKHIHDHRHGVYPLLPGGFATLEMWPSKPGLWLLESEAGLSQQRGMQTLFLVLDNVCDHALGLSSGTVKDSQITASDFRSYWLPSLARLHNTGKYNAWSSTISDAWIQVDFQRPVVISKVATQGAKQLFTSHFVQNYTVSYSTDRKRWIFYKGDSKAFRKNFEGNREAYEVKENTFFPPIIGRYVRLHPSDSYNYPTVRMEFFGCELDGCSVPLGMQSGFIKDQQISASSVVTNWYSGPWQPWFGRLDKQGAVNAWQAKSNDMQPWIQIELKVVKKITGIVTQGAKTLGTEMFVTSYVLEYSDDDGRTWTKYTDDEDYEQKTFLGNSDNNSHVKNYIYPPIFSKFIRIIPKKWQNAITMRIELLGCDFE
ncbi:coagulation factor V [Brachyhypopomus gauderio]|uniref:coagulation factor V n=1 Tax=Brachyhypopomus gauderio TaxID=698409 RepID=UPI004042949D